MTEVAPFELLIYAATGAVVARWPLTMKEIVIGRDPACDIHLDSPRVSRRHARVVATRRGHRIEDLGSTNGLWKGGVRGSSWDLKLGEEVEFGGYRALYIVSGEDPGRTIPDDPPSAKPDAMHVDLDRHEVRLGERPLPRPLSSLEFRLLSYLYSHAGRVCSRDDVGSAVWGVGRFEDIMVHQLVHRVREKLNDQGTHPRYIFNVPGQGYRLDP